MNQSRDRFRLWTWRLLAGWGFLVSGSLAPACSVPVFRYALEHWPADPYRAVVLHRGPLSVEGQALADRLRDGSGAARANLAVQSVDLAQADPALVELWKKAGSPAEPWVLIGGPRTGRSPVPFFSAPLEGATVASILDSPARRELARRLGEGESAVWLLLESGDRAKDDAALRLLEARLAYLPSVMELPKLDAQDIKNGLVSVPDEGLKLAFSTLRVSRQDPAERFLVSMLLATEGDLPQQRDPMVFPVFGQARVLYALVGGGIAHETIDRAASFLIGSCSCQVKEQNPGADLLLAADWKKMLREQSVGVPDLPKASEITGALPDTVTIAPQPGAGRPAAPECCGAMAWIKAHRGPVASVAVVATLLFGFAVGRAFRKPSA